MTSVLTIDKVIFNIRTQSLLNFTPISFIFKHRNFVRGETFEKNYWNDDVHKTLGKDFITFVDNENKLWEIKIINFPKQYDRIVQALEITPNLIPEQFNLLEAGLVNVNFLSVINLAYNKYIVPRKMGERSSYQG
ncbi:MAG: hypothetical protein KatS3mg068_2404 [Candidatus Sericytochromatia bacterium]|nr:MAG: hypothetical protein KatS3mg068_2404 [Candidatus Sericytochromatia bacterium]